MDARLIFGKSCGPRFQRTSQFKLEDFSSENVQQEGRRIRMATKVKFGATKGANKRSTKPARPGSSSKIKKSSSIKAAAKTTQHKPKPTTATATKKKPPHLRYTEKELKVPALNGIKPTGVQKVPNKKKGKNFVDDGDGMRTILAMVMAEKEGNIESKMMRARQMEEIREAGRVEAEKRAESKKAGLEERKDGIRGKKKGRRGIGTDELAGAEKADGVGVVVKRAKKVSFG